MSNLYHRDIRTEFIIKVYAVMVRSHWHRFQVLTKRSDRLVELDPVLSWPPNI